jgi:5-methylcytosine-specific restriction enzyme subunit McrC
VRRSLLVLDAALNAVSRVDYDPREVPSVSYTRLNQHYRPAVELARLILRSTSFELGHGAVRASSFLVDMNRVFEDFVVIALRDALRLTPAAFPQNAAGRSLHLDVAQRVELRPDISWWDGSICRFVGDVKYKRIAAPGILHPDLYQLLAYLTATDLPAGLLIYAAGEAEVATHRVVHAGKDLRVVTLDLDGPPEFVLSQVGKIAERVRAMYVESPGHIRAFHAQAG